MDLEREPEPEIVMESPDSVAGFDRAGLPGGPLFPIYHFNATRLSRLLPEDATVVDVFCGSGRLLSHLLDGRPDLKGFGVDLSESMLTLAGARLADAGLDDRVELVQANAADLATVATGRVDAVTSLSALHHCPTVDDLEAVLAAVKAVRDRDGAAVWLFDLVRPADESLLELIPRAHEVAAGHRLDPWFRRDWSTSLHAGWTFEELSAAAGRVGLDLEGREANYSQLHWAGPRGRFEPTMAWQGQTPEKADLDRAEVLAQALGMP